MQCGAIRLEVGAESLVSMFEALSLMDSSVAVVGFGIENATLTNNTAAREDA